MTGVMGAIMPLPAKHGDRPPGHGPIDIGIRSAPRRGGVSRSGGIGESRRAAVVVRIDHEAVAYGMDTEVFYAGESVDASVSAKITKQAKDAVRNLGAELKRLLEG